MKKALLVAGAALFVMLVASCTGFQLSGVQLNEEMPSYDSVGDFETTITVNEFVGSPAGVNLFNATSTAMDTEIYDAVRREINKMNGDAAVNVTVVYKATFVDILLGGITFGIYTPAHAVISGTVVNIQ
jgi:hypothetical protein